VLITNIPIHSTGMGYYVRIYGDAPSYTLLNEGYGFSNQPVSVETLVPAGSYFIRVSRNSGDNSSAIPYTLNVNLDTNNSFLTAANLILCDTLSALTRNSNDTDYYALPALSAESYVTAYNTPSSVVLTITAYDNVYNVVGVPISSVAGQAVTYSSLPPSAAYISVRETNFSGNAGEYKLTLLDSSCYQSTTIDNKPETLAFAIRPNPNNGRFTVKTSAADNKPVTISVTDMLGRPIKETTAASVGETVIMLDVPAGVYFVTVSAETARHTEKIIIQ